MVSVEYLPWQHGWRMGAGGGACVWFLDQIKIV